MPELRHAHWLTIHTHPHAERRAEAHLQRQGFTTYLPRILKARRHARREDTVIGPFFPRYLFVGVEKANNQRWHSINSTIGVSRLVTAGNEPCWVDAGIIQELKSRESADGFINIAPAIAQLPPGAPVRVVSGAFEHCHGLFEAIRAEDRVAILLELLGRSVRVVVNMVALESA